MPRRVEKGFEEKLDDLVLEAREDGDDLYDIVSALELATMKLKDELDG